MFGCILTLIIIDIMHCFKIWSIDLTKNSNCKNLKLQDIL